MPFGGLMLRWTHLELFLLRNKDGMMAIIDPKMGQSTSSF
jgi:hypothetical protein